MIDKKLHKAWCFFLEWAGYANPPGRATCALNLARAERAGKEAGLTFAWEEDPESWSAILSDQRRGYRDPYCPLPERVEGCRCFDSEGMELPASLWGIEDASPQYRRVIEAEMAMEAIHAINAQLVGLDPSVPPGVLQDAMIDAGLRE